MALSDALTKLAAQTKSLEASAEDVKQKNDAAVKARIVTLNTSLTETKTKASAGLEQAGDQAKSDWDAMQDSVSSTFDSLHAKAAAHRAALKEKHAESVAEGSEWDAEDAVDFAVYAIQEAEYAVLQAAVDRETADELSA